MRHWIKFYCKGHQTYHKLNFWLSNFIKLNRSLLELFSCPLKQNFIQYLIWKFLIVVKAKEFCTYLRQNANFDLQINSLYRQFSDKVLRISSSASFGHFECWSLGLIFKMTIGREKNELSLIHKLTTRWCHCVQIFVCLHFYLCWWPLQLLL